MKVRNAIIGASMALLLAGPVWAQTRTASDAPTRVAVINLQQAISQTAEGKQASQQLQTKFGSRQNALTDLQNKLQGLQQQAKDGANTLSESAKAALAEQYQLEYRQYQRDQQEMNQEVQDAQQNVVDAMSVKMDKVIQKYASEHEFSLVLDTSNSAVLYFANPVDITNAIVKLYDQTYPVAAAAAAPKPKSKK